MDRVPFFENLVAFERARQKAIDATRAANGDFDEMDPLDNPQRVDVCPGTYLKEDDDVSCYNGTLQVRVICASSPRDAFCCWWMDAELGTPTIGVCQVQYVTDRAPADPNEEGMPNGSIYLPVDP